MTVEIATAPPPGALPEAEDPFVFPASYGQRRLWFLDRLHPGNPAYNLFDAVRLRGPLDLPALAATLAALVARHESLRTTFAGLRGDPVQVVAPRGTVRLATLDLSALPPAVRERELGRLAVAEALRPFDLVRGPLLRVSTVRLGGDDHAVLFALHHIVGDGWSMGILVREVAALYGAFLAGEPPALAALPPLTVQYADHSEAQREWLAGPVLAEQLAAWRRRLAGLAPLDLPADRPRPPVRSFRGAYRTLAVAPPLTADLLALARRRGTTLFVTLLAALDAFLFRYTGSSDVAVATAVAGRGDLAAESLIGFFVNTLVLRSTVRGEMPFKALLDGAHETAMAAFAMQDVPFEKLVEELAPERNLSRAPLTDVLLVLQNTPPAALDLPGLAAGAVPLAGRTAKLDWTWSVVQRGVGSQGSLVVSLEYSTDLFDAPTAERAVRHWHVLLTAAAADPGRPVGDLPLLLAAERHQAVVEAADRRQVPAGEPLHRRFERWAAAAPAAPAVTWGGTTLTYADLDRRAERLARRLAAHGAGAESLVAIQLPRGFGLVTAILATLKAGAAYVPLDPALPEERRRLLLEDCGARLLIAEEGAEVPGIVRIGIEGAADLHTTAAPLPAVDPAQAAYVIYTSGSTGRPKGVVVSHANVGRLLDVAAPLAGVGRGDVWTLFHSAAFDFSVWEIWGALALGGRLVIVPEEARRSPGELAALLDREAVTVLDLTPQAFYALLAWERESGRRAGAPLRRLRRVIFGGEALAAERVAPWLGGDGREQAPRPGLINMYGITETTVHVTWLPLAAAAGGGAAVGSRIGRPLPDLSLHVLDAAGAPVPIGVAGELHVCGAGLARGYLGAPERTAERFVPDPFSGRAGERLYRTGDLGRRLPDGSLEYLGRVDRQLKVRGHRIEPGEVEAALVRHPQVAAAVVELRETAAGERLLVGYVVPHGGEEPSAGVLRSHLLTLLPEPMVPAVFVTLAALPLTENGKVDRRALPAPSGARPDLGAPYVAPRTEAERRLAEVWAEVLGVDRVGVLDGFFALGGDSIRSLRAVALAAQRGVRVSLQDLFQRSTIASLLAPAAVGADGEEMAPVPPFALLDPGGRRRLVEGTAGAEGVEDAYPLTRMQAGMLFHSEYGEEAGLYHNVRILEIEGPLSLSALARAAAELMSRHPVLRTSFDLARSGEPLQLVWRSVPLPLRVADLAALPEERRGEALDAWFAAERAARFDLGRAPLLRLTAVPLAPGRFALGVTEHHAILDGWSVALLLRELFELYTARLAGRPADLPPPPAIAFRDFVAAERAALASETQRAWWTERLRDTEPSRLPRWAGGAGPAAGTAGPRQETLDVPLPAGVSEGLRRTARLAGAPLKSALLAAHLRVLALAAGGAEVVTGLAVNGRPAAEEGERVLGLFLNTVPLVLRLMPGSLLDLVRAAFAAESALLPYRRFPMAEVRRLLGGRELYEAAFNYTHFHVLRAVAERTEELRVVADRGFAENSFVFLAGFAVDLAADRLSLTLVYDAAQLGRAEIAAAGGWYARALAALAALAERPESAQEPLPLLSAAELHQLTVEAGDTAAAFPREAGLAALFLDQARRAPGAPAVRAAGATLSYGHLARRAWALADRLRAAGVRRGDLVGLCLERSAELIVATLAVVAAGGAYLPLDPEHPPARLASLLADAGVRIVLGPLPPGAAGGRTQIAVPPVAEASGEDQEPTAAGSPEASGAGGSVASGPGGQAGAGAGSRTAVAAGELSLPDTGDLPVAGGGDLAYVIYTSGSTGRPKGVAVTQRAVARLVVGSPDLPLAAADRIAHAANPAFDAATFEIWGALLNGGQVTVVPRDVLLDADRLAEAIRGEGLSQLFLTTPLFQKVARLRPDAFAPLACLIVGGELLDHSAAARVLAAGAPRRLLNAYGPTESTTFATLHPVAPDGVGPVPIGRPIANTRVEVLDAALRAVPLGAPGELCIGGEGLAVGYHGRSDATAERFIPDPLAVEPGARLYRTGDRVRWRPDGALDFLGRLDQQVKLRGFRVEPQEVEAVLQRHPGVRQAAVTVEGAGEDRRLVAWVTLNGAGAAGAARGADGSGAANGTKGANGATDAEVANVASGANGKESGAGAPGEAELRAHARALLPEFMVPAAVVLLDALPLTASGKLDRRALAGRAPAGGGAPVAGGEAPGTGGAGKIEPRGDLERIVADIWEEVLGSGPVGADDDFFALGGHSLKATEVVSRLRRALRLELPIRALFEAPTVAELSREIERRLGLERGPEPPPLVRLPPAAAATATGAAAVSTGSAAPAPEGSAAPAPAGTACPAGAPGIRGAGAAEAEERLPLSFAQQRLWLLDRLAPGLAVYNIPFVLEIAGPLSVPALATALSAVVERHETLRTTYGAVRGESFQRIAPAAPVVLPCVDLSALGGGGAARVREAERLAAAAAVRPFDLAAGPVLRLLLMRLAPGLHRLAATVHHVASDGWSMAILTTEAAALYAAALAERPAALPELPVRYSDYARWQRRFLSGAVLAAEIAHWRARLADLPPLLPLPADRPRPPVQSFRGAEVSFVLPARLAAALHALGRSQGATLYMTSLAGFAVLLGRAAGEERFAVGSPIAGRGHQEIEGLIGFFVNTLVLAVDLRGDPPFTDLLARLREVVLDAQSHQELPFERLVEAVEPQRSLSHTPLFQVMLVLQNLPLAAAEIAELRLRQLPAGGAGAKFDLTLALQEAGGAIGGALEYAADLFDRTTAARLAGRFAALLAAAAERPEAPLSALSALAPAERQQLLAEWNDRAGWASSADGRDGAAAAASAALSETAHERFAAPAHERFAAQAARTPERPAVRFAGEELRYGEIESLANRLARRLRRAGAGPEVPVALLLDRSLEMVVALFAALKAGSPFAALDPLLPPASLAATLGALAASAPPIVVLHEWLADRLPDGEASRVERIPLDGSWDFLHEEDDSPLGLAVPPQALACLLFTSGVTGPPRRVAVPHVAVTALLAWADGWAVSADVALALAAAPLGSALALFEILVPLAHGGTLLVAENALDLLAVDGGERVTMVTGLPSAVAEIARLGALPAALRSLRLTGEALPAALAERLAALPAAPAVRNLYGAAEAPVAAAAALPRPGGARGPGGDPGEPGNPGGPGSPERAGAPGTRGAPAVSGASGVSEAPGASGTLGISGGSGVSRAGLPVGRPVAGTAAYVLDGALDPVPLGSVGELYLGGAGLARGYLGDPARTAERFLPDPWSGRRSAPGSRLLRTGDLVRHLPDGRLHLLGGGGRQVRVRGFRIDLGEVEAALAAHPAVREVAVVVRGSDAEGGVGSVGSASTVGSAAGESSAGAPGPGGAGGAGGAVGVRGTGHGAATDRGGGAAGERRIVAYWVAAPPAPTPAELRAFLRDRLPDFMVPAAFVPLAALPRTAGGKLDPGALPEPEQAGTTGPIGPRDLLELRLVRLWEEVLGVRPVGVRDGFFKLGGHSLLAVPLMARIREQFGRELPLASLFQAGTVENLAALLRRDGGLPPREPLVAITAPASDDAGSASGRLPFFCVHPAGGNVLCYADLARALGPEQPFYGLQLPEVDAATPRELPALAALYVRALRAAQPHGPYHLGGWSLGAVVAFEMARQLATAGQEVALLAMIDVPPPGVQAAWEEEEVDLMAWFARDLAALSGQRVSVSPADLRRIPADDRLRRVVAAAQAAHLLPPDIGLPEAEGLFAVFRAAQQAMRAYVPAPYPGAALLVVAQPAADEGGEEAAWAPPEDAWAPLVQGGLTIERIACEHYTIVRPPHVETLAGLLRARIGGGGAAAEKGLGTGLAAEERQGAGPGAAEIQGAGPAASESQGTGPAVSEGQR